MSILEPTKFGPILSADMEFVEAFTGWTIKSVGMTYDFKYEDEIQPTSVRTTKKERTSYIEGGLTFVLEKDGETKKVILGYTELGEWIEFEGAVDA